MSKILFLNGSDRKGGNLEIIFQQMIQGFESVQNGHATIKMINLADLNIHPCKGCFHCRKNNDCIFHDDATAVIQEIIQADYIIIGSPIYFFQISGQTKLLMDRLYPLMSGEPRNYGLRYGTKKTIAVYTQGAPVETAFQDYLSIQHKALALLGLMVEETLISTNSNILDAVTNNQPILDRAFNIGTQLFITPTL